MSKEIDHITKARQDKRQKTGWTLEEIKQQAAKDFENNQKIAQESEEPEGFYSGDMDKFLKGQEDDDEEC